MASESTEDWTLTVIRSELGQEIIDEMVAGGALEVRPGDDDPGALALMGQAVDLFAAALAGPERGRASAGVPPPKARRLPVPPPGLPAADNAARLRDGPLEWLPLPGGSWHAAPTC